MFEGIRRRLSGLLDALGGDEPVSREEMNRVLAGMREELIEHRARLKAREEEVDSYQRRFDELRDRGDVDPTALVELEATLTERKAEVEEERAAVRELTERFKEAVRRRDLLLTTDRRTRASETVRGAGEDAVRDYERLEEEIEEEALEVDARRSLERELEGGPADADPGFERRLEEAEADELLRRLKRDMESGGDAPGEGGEAR